MSVDYWDEVLAMERQLVGPHYPTITNALFKKWDSIGELISDPKQCHLIKEWQQVSKELEKEFVITHGKEHPDYWKIARHLKEADLIIKMMKLQS